MYLEHDWEFAAHTLQFPSTNQYYKTAKYELHRATGDGVTVLTVFRQTL